MDNQSETLQQQQQQNQAYDITHNPYYLHPRENPGMILVSPPLDATNYHSWSRATRRALKSKNKFKFVDDTIREPQETNPSFEAWEICNTMVISWITRSLTQSIVQSSVYIENTQILWHDLKERFSKGDYFRTSDLLQEVHSIKQGDRSISTFFTDLKTIWEDLETLRPIPGCICAIKCSCSLVKTIKTQRDNEYVMCFLKALNDQFHTVRSQILLMEPLPPINKAFSLVLQQERQEEGMSSTEAKWAINSLSSNLNWRNSSNKSFGKGNINFNNGGSRRFSSTTSNRTSNSNTSNKVCSFCGKNGHTIETCYFKHGFPPNFKFKSKGSISGSINNILISHEGSSDDQRSEQRQIDQNSSQDTPHLSINYEHAINQASQEIEQHPNHNISGNILNDNSWIFDSGATDHITNNISNYLHYEVIKPITIKLPNNLTILAKHSGIVKLSKDLVLHNVLHIPGLKYNLVSIHKLACDSQMQAYF
ncbi:hypothetical protein Lal_00049540 [Lupinus albus]|nr:hypothetical protein Lal_00049540 [Lupinus albus]